MSFKEEMNGSWQRFVIATTVSFMMLIAAAIKQFMLCLELHGSGSLKDVCAVQQR